MMLNKKGQGSGVFQLLISAVVALAILGVLLGIIGGLPSIGSQDPVEGARNTLKQAESQPGSVKFSSKVTFTRDTVLNRLGVTPRESGIVSDRICISWRESFDTSFGGRPSGTIAAYQGSGTRDAKLGVVCDDGINLQTNAEEVFNNEVEVPSDCMTRDPADPEADELFCLVAIVPP